MITINVVLGNLFDDDDQLRFFLFQSFVLYFFFLSKFFFSFLFFFLNVIQCDNETSLLWLLSKL